MSSMRELYQEMIIDHSRSPRNHKKLENPNLSARGHNPLCGDEIDMEVKRGEDGVLSEIGFEATPTAGGRPRRRRGRRAPGSRCWRGSRAA